MALHPYAAAAAVAVARPWAAVVAWASEAAVEIVPDHREGLCTPMEDQKSQELALQEEVHDLQCE